MMNQIYDFEQHQPPVLNENMLRRELNRRRLHRQPVLLVLAGVLFQIAVVLLGYSAMDWYPGLCALCFGYVFVSTAGCAVVAATYTRKGGITP